MNRTKKPLDLDAVRIDTLCKQITPDFFARHKGRLMLLSRLIEIEDIDANYSKAIQYRKDK